MKLSEKTLELNFCTQLPVVLNCKALWFGLTQRQEAQLGFDAHAELNGQLFFFQFKAPSNIQRQNEFKLDHKQLATLKGMCRSERTVFYAFPLLGGDSELLHKRNVTAHTWLLDVWDLPEQALEPKEEKPKHLVVIEANKATAHLISKYKNHPKTTIKIKIFLATDLLSCSKINPSDMTHIVDTASIGKDENLKLSLESYASSKRSLNNSVLGLLYQDM